MYCCGELPIEEVHQPAFRERAEGRIKPTDLPTILIMFDLILLLPLLSPPPKMRPNPPNRQPKVRPSRANTKNILLEKPPFGPLDVAHGPPRPTDVHRLLLPIDAPNYSRAAQRRVLVPQYRDLTSAESESRLDGVHCRVISQDADARVEDVAFVVKVGFHG